MSFCKPLLHKSNLPTSEYDFHKSCFITSYLLLYEFSSFSFFLGFTLVLESGMCEALYILYVLFELGPALDREAEKFAHPSWNPAHSWDIWDSSQPGKVLKCVATSFPIFILFILYTNSFRVARLSRAAIHCCVESGASEIVFFFLNWTTFKSVPRSVGCP